jgi:hypothetical protein
VGMALLAVANDRAIEHVQRGEQRGCSVTFAVVRHRLGTSLLQCQTGLRAIQRLHLALPVAAQHQCVAASGVVRVVSSTSLATFTCTAGAPSGRSCSMPCSPRSRWRSRQRVIPHTSEAQ